MDIIDNLIYATLASPLQPLKINVASDNAQIVSPAGYPQATQRIISDYITTFMNDPAGVDISVKPDNVGTLNAHIYSYKMGDKMAFCAYQDPAVIDATIERHWYDINVQKNYDSDGTHEYNFKTTEDNYASFSKSSPYHLIFAYLIENTRIFQIFERMIERYLSDEEFGIADDPTAFNWIHNTEKLFFKNDSLRPFNLRSLIRPNADASRRNAYWRMFGMDLAYGDINLGSGGELNYIKAKTSNLQFVPLFEKYLSEIWQSYINANNSSGINTSDINIVIDLATQLRELLIARRGDVDNATYANQNLSREEFSSVLTASWFMLAVSDDTPVVQFLKCQSSTPGERLIKIGNKVGIQAHAKCQSLFEMAGAASNILRKIEEGGIFDDPTHVPDILKSLITTGSLDADKNLMSDLLTVVNFWEKATLHSIKKFDASLNASLRIQHPLPAHSNGKMLPTNGKPVVTGAN